MGFNASREVIDSEKYAEKFGDVTASEKGARVGCVLCEGVSFKDITTLNNYPEIILMLAAGYDETVYFLSVGDGKRLDLIDRNEFNFAKNYWQRQYRDYDAGAALIKIAKEMRREYYVK
jgi:hypothetical protein